MSHSGGIAVKHPDTVHQETPKDRSGSTTVGWSIKKLPFDQISLATTGDYAIAVVAEPERPLCAESASRIDGEGASMAGQPRQQLLGAHERET